MMADVRASTPLTTRFVRCDSGATAIEYALSATLIAVVVVSSVRTLGVNVNRMFVSVGTALSR